jgi:hypothetical protein
MVVSDESFDDGLGDVAADFVVVVAKDVLIGGILDDVAAD